MANLDEAIGRIEEGIKGVHSRMGMVEGYVEKLGTSTGEFQKQMIDRMARVEERVEGVKCTATEAKAEARKAGAKAGGLLGTFFAAVLFGLLRLLGIK